jgi:hypothetical protein
MPPHSPNMYRDHYPASPAQLVGSPSLYRNAIKAPASPAPSSTASPAWVAGSPRYQPPPPSSPASYAGEGQFKGGSPQLRNSPSAIPQSLLLQQSPQVNYLPWLKG